MLIKNTIMIAGSYPECFDTKEQYDTWRLMSRMSKSSPPAWVCTDCTPDYQIKMIAERRCENPHVSFRINPKEGGIEGYIDR